MTDVPPREPGGRRAILLARLALLWEGLWAAAWPAVAILGIAATIALFDLPARLPGWLHLALALAFAAALVWALWRLGRGLSLPGYEAARRRLERDSGLAHRPLAALEDRLAMGAGDAFAEALWRVHLARMRKTLGRVRVRPPHPGLPGRDPIALRLLLLLVLALGLVDAGSDAGARLVRAVSPELAPLAPRMPANLQLWLTPPAYTGLPPIYLHVEEAAKADHPAAPAKPVSVPAESRLLARLQGGSGVPELVLGQSRIAFEPVDATTFRLDGAILPVERIAVEQGGRTVASWPIALIPDSPPSVAFAAPPTQTLRAALRLEYAASDDYGVASVKAEIRRAGAPPGESPLAVELPLPNGHPRQAREASFHDLSAHPWAGLPVTIRLFASDEPGHVGSSEPVEMILPERVFHHPVAREIAEARKIFTREPTNRFRTARALDAIAGRPDRFGNDKAVFLSLITVRARLLLDHSTAAIAPVQQQLWETALAVEEGHLPAAERELRALQEMLRQALANGASDRDIERLMAQLEAAIERYLAELAKTTAADGKTAPPQLGQNAQPLHADELRRLMDRAREMARTGARDAARQLLSQLQDILENLRAGRADSGAKGKGAASALMRGLDELIDRQGKMLERSFRAAPQDGGAPPPEQPGASDPATDQEDARKALGEIMRKLGEMGGDIPGALGKAEQAMRDATSALRRRAPGDAVDPQGQALQGLREGRQSMLEGLRQALGEEGDEDSLDAFGPGHDPSGRTMPGYGRFDGNDVRIPDHGQVQRAREIQDELQRRAGQRQRPEFELDYIERLLKRF